MGEKGGTRQLFLIGWTMATEANDKWTISVVRDIPRSFAPTTCSEEGWLLNQTQAILNMSQSLQKTTGNSTLVCAFALWHRANTFCSSKAKEMWQKQGRFTPRGCRNCRSSKAVSCTAGRGKALGLIAAETLQGSREPFHPSQGVTAVHSSVSYYKKCLETNTNRTF